MDNLKRAFGLLLICLIANVAMAQNVYKGRVIDSKGEPLTGATVMEAGTKNGAVTDINGNFTITLHNPKNLLHVSFVGFKDQDVKAKRNLIVTLDEDNNSLDELVVVGYGVQKRRDIVGAIDQVSGDAVENRANTNITRSLQGQIPGLTITQSDGRATQGGTIRIRGNVNSIGAGGGALVLIDGVEGSLSQVNPDDVESVSVLKDASSAAIYGARGAFGVILVTTKSAKAGKPVIKYNGQVSAIKRTVDYDVVTNGLQYATDYAEAWLNSKGVYPSKINNEFGKHWVSWDDWYEELKVRDANPHLEKQRINANGYYDYFGNTDWFKEFYRDTDFATQHNVSVSGGSNRSTYYISGGYYGNNGIYRVGNEHFNRYNLRAKGTIKLNKWLNLANNTDVYIADYYEPIVQYTYSRDLNDRIPIQRQIVTEGFPVATLRNTDGTWTQAAVYTGYAAFADGTSWRKQKWARLTNTTTLTADIIKDVLQAKADFTYKRQHTTRNQITNTEYAMISPTEQWTTHADYDAYEERYYDNEYMAANATLDWTPKLKGGHYFKGMGGWNLEKENYRTTRAQRNGVLFSDMANFNFTDSDIYFIGDNGSYDWAYVGFFYRLNYNWKGRYLIETSGRYDGSSKFPADQQWGFFPSASAGWRISEEPWMKGMRDKFLDNLKLRGSIGEAGNGLVDPYSYLSIMNISHSTTAILNGQQVLTTQAPSPIPTGLTWEKVITYNLGLDVDMFKNRFNFSFDIYRKDTRDMYVVGPELPAVYGNNPPKGNNANMKTNGWELSIGWRDNFQLAGKPFNYHVKAALWDATSKITKYTARTNTCTGYYEGKELGEIWGFDIEGLFQNAADVANHADQSWLKNFNQKGQVWEAGDLKFRDVNGDKKIDNGNNTLEDHGDLIKIGNTTPRYLYSFTIGASWNGIGLETFWQGVGKRDWMPNTEAGLFWGQYGRGYGYDLPWQSASDRAGIDEDGNITNPNAYWPRLRAYIANSSRGPMSVNNNRYLQNARYLRLKTITLSYTLPSALIKRIGLTNVMVYLSGENLFTFTPLHKYAKNYDPEVIGAGDTEGWTGTSGSESAGSGYSYPMTKSVSFGLNISF